MRKFIFGLFMLISCQVPFAAAQSTDEPDIDRLFQDLKQTLIKRSTPYGLLSPSLMAAQRDKEVQKAIRPYISLQFKYNVADMRRENLDDAKLPLIVEYETAHEVGRLTGSAQLERVDGRWYFRDFDFMTFPWALVLGMSSIGVAFAVVVLYFYRRYRKRQRHPIPT